MHKTKIVICSEYQELACQVVEVAHALDREKALLITERPHPHLGNMNCQELAVAANDKVGVFTGTQKLLIEIHRHANVPNVNRPALDARLAPLVHVDRVLWLVLPPVRRPLAAA
jgi:hypothetical protein